MGIAANNVATTNDYSNANTRLRPGSARVNLIVSNAAIYYQLADERGNFGAFDEVFAVPGLYSLDRTCGGCRVRSGAVGVPARVTFELIGAEELPDG